MDGVGGTDGVELEGTDGGGGGGGMELGGTRWSWGEQMGCGGRSLSKNW